MNETEKYLVAFYNVFCRNIENGLIDKIYISVEERRLFKEAEKYIKNKNLSILNLS